MTWSALLPQTWNPLAAVAAMREGATFLQGLTDAFIQITVYGGLVMLLVATLRTVRSRRMAGRYLRVIPRSLSRQAFANSRQELAGRADLPLFAEWDALLVQVPGRSGTLERTLHRAGDAGEVFNESSLAQGIVGNRLVLAVPGILTGLGVLGTFVGLQLGIGSLDLNDLGKLDQSIKPLIQGCATAFSTSVWGVVTSLGFIVAEKLLEGAARGPIRRLAARLNSLVPRFTPEASMVEMQRATEQTESILKGLAVAIGDQMQKAMDRLGGSITEAVRDALGGQAQDLGKMSADLLGQALTSELGKLQAAVTGMAERFGTAFNGANARLQQTVASFEPTVRALGDTVTVAQATVREAVDKLNAHESVMLAMSGAAQQINDAAARMEALREQLDLAGQRHVMGAEAQGMRQANPILCLS